LYAYSVNGQSYAGAQIYPGISWWSRQGSQQAVASYPPATQHAVHFFPDDPSEAFLETGLHPKAFQKLILGSFLLSFLVIFCAAAYLMPKYGVKQPDGSYWLGFESPVTRGLCFGLLLVALQFVLFWQLRP
jgi:hypothetical protein